MSNLGRFMPVHRDEVMMERGAPSVLVPVTMLAGRSVELVAGMALILGIFPRLAALALFAFLVPATLAPEHSPSSELRPRSGWSRS
jgi:uncharacterized membrane protein YphA (DoxX/SURF4 family)